MSTLKPWQLHEKYVADSLGLDLCIASGNKYYDPGDAVQRGHYTESNFPIIADAKCTEKKSYSVKQEFVREWVDKAVEMGKRFIMPIRFHATNEWGRPVVDDYVLLTFDDFLELLEAQRALR